MQIFARSTWSEHVRWWWRKKQYIRIIMIDVAVTILDELKKFLPSETVMSIHWGLLWGWSWCKHTCIESELIIHSHSRLLKSNMCDLCSAAHPILSYCLGFRLNVILVIWCLKVASYLSNTSRSSFRLFTFLTFYTNISWWKAK